MGADWGSVKQLAKLALIQFFGGKDGGMHGDVEG
jgi:hypothetical protein